MADVAHCPIDPGFFPPSLSVYNSVLTTYVGKKDTSNIPRRPRPTLAFPGGGGKDATRSEIRQFVSRFFFKILTSSWC